MAAKVLLVFCAQVFFVQVSLSQCIGYDAYPGPIGAWGYDGLGPIDGYGFGPYDGVGAPWSGGCGGLNPANLAASYGGGLAVTSISPIAPTGITVNSENVIEGTVNVFGQLPFLGAVATDGTFGTNGVGTVLYGCGDGAIGITNEAPIAPAPGYGPGYGPGYAGGYGWNEFNAPGPYGCGCGLY
ncbi:chorion class CB protein M5H4-like [Bombyx mori]|uniref:Chorion early B n=1 Tax=Bombyx mori TaxID=7091 RepID=A0A0K2S2Y2_BOMMO|nr:chorion class CB protein M5H4-like [Bombyx mori]BAS21466.1 chorion early B [Bombyx mori]